MTVHLVKLCVGIDKVPDLRAWQAQRVDEMTKMGQVPELCHKTKQMPRRRKEVLDGGSIYWVIKGFVSARQRIMDLTETVREDGSPCCGIVLDSQIVETRPMPRRPFQGWRYLDAGEAPLDLSHSEDSIVDMPAGMREELRTLRLID